MIHAGGNISQLISSRVKQVAATSLLQSMKFVTSIWKAGVLAPSEHTWAVALSPRHVSIGRSSRVWEPLAKTTPTAFCQAEQGERRDLLHPTAAGFTPALRAPSRCEFSPQQLSTTSLLSHERPLCMGRGANPFCECWPPVQMGVSTGLAPRSWVGSGPSCMSLRTLMKYGIETEFISLISKY